MAERETQAAQRQGVREQVGVIDQQTATLGGSVNFGGKVTFQ